MNKLLLFILLHFPFLLFSQSKAEFVFINQITFKGNKITKEKILLRELNFQINDSISKKNIAHTLENSKNRLLNLQLFSTVQYEIQWIDSNHLAIHYSLTEILYWLANPTFSLADRNFNVWWKEQHRKLNRTNIGIEGTRLNFRGRNEQITASIQMGYNRYIGFSYKIPYIDKNMQQGVGISMLYETGQETNYTTDKNKLLFFKSEFFPYQRFQTKLYYTYRPKYVAIHEVQLSYNTYTISDDLYNANPNYLGYKKNIQYIDLSYIYQYNNTNIRNYPTKGIESKTIISKKGLGIDKDINRFEISHQTTFYKPIWKRISSSFVIKTKIASTYNQPYIFNRALGFKNEYLRGYEYYVIDGSRYAMLRSNIRFKLVDKVVKQKIFPLIKYIPLKIYSKIFDDIGYVYNVQPGNSFLNNQTLNAYGIGLDIVISYYAKFRLEYSINQLHQKGLFLHSTKE